MRKKLPPGMTHVVDDLLTWSAEEERRLPRNVFEIEKLEAQGFIVDLVTGAVTPDPDAHTIPLLGSVYAD